VAIEDPFERSVIIGLAFVVNRTRRSSLWTLSFGLACCALEMIALTMARFDVRERSRYASPLIAMSERSSQCGGCLTAL
jgi:NADH-quinone oxidoreductase subunit B